jgi:hypothetical protein
MYVGRCLSYGYRMTKQFSLLYKVYVLSIFISGVPASSSSSLSFLSLLSFVIRKPAGRNRHHAACAYLDTCESISAFESVDPFTKRDMKDAITGSPSLYLMISYFEQ